MTAVPIDHSGRRKAEPFDRRTFQPVRRNSRPVARENWRAVSRKEANRWIFALKVYRSKLRQPGQRWGAAGTISAGAIGFYELLCNMAVKNSGRIEPSAEWLATALNVPIKVIHAWKGQLKAHGFLDWMRRYVETGRDGHRGPQVQQTTNAYRLGAPPEAMAAADKLQPPPPPDAEQRAKDRREEVWRMENPAAASALDTWLPAIEARDRRLRSD